MDRGGILVLTLVLTVVMSVVVLALATFVTTGLTTSRVTTDRTNAVADLEAAVHDVADQLAGGADPCPSVRPEFTPNDSAVTVTQCAVAQEPGRPRRVTVSVSSGSVRATAEIDVIPAELLLDDRGIAVVTSWHRH